LRLEKAGEEKRGGDKGIVFFFVWRDRAFVDWNGGWNSFPVLALEWKTKIPFSVRDPFF